MKKLLLVDDDPGIQMMLGDFLMGAGYEVTVAGTGEAALEQMTQSLPDLVILDMGMPGMGGTGFLERITDANGHTRVPVLVLTARSAMAEFFADKQIAGFLTKPADPDELVAEVQRILFMSADLPKGDTLIVGDDTRRLVVLAEGNPIRNNAVREALIKAGFSVESVFTGAEAVETVISRHPAGLVMPMDSSVMAADAVLEILRKLPASEKLPAVVYHAEAAPMKRVFLNLALTTVVDGTDGQLIARAALARIV